MKNKGASTKINGLVRNGLFRILFIAPLFVIAMACTPIMRAAGVVSSCDEASLLAALSGGGKVTFTCSGTITLTGTITVSADTIIDGAGQNVTVSGGFATQVIFVSSGAQLELNKVTIADGFSEFGGGILNLGTLTVSHSSFSSNYSRTYGGGGILNGNGAVLTVTNSTFSDNHAYFNSGGGILNYATLTVMNSTFSGNSADYIGGGIATFAPLTVSNSTFYGNNAGIYGGGLSNGQQVYPILVINNTFSGNSSGGGGNIHNIGPLTLRNTIVANSLSGGNCRNYGVVLNDSGNLDTDGTCVGTISPDPLLGPLQNNGGPTQTMAIPMASPAFGGANPANCPTTDQRGVLRPQFMACDVGAYEFDTANSLLTAVRNNILTLIPTGNQHDQTTLTAVASALAAALNSHNWHGTDGNHLNPSEGEDVFELLVEGASGRLMQLLKASPPSVIPAQTLQTLLNNVTLAGRTLATVAISDSPGGNPTKLAQANALVAKGDADAATGKYISALVNYDIAWSLLHGD